MNIDFYIYNTHEIIVWENIWRELNKQGVNAKMILEPPGLNTAYGSVPYKSKGYLDIKTQNIKPLMTDFVFKQAIKLLEKLNIPYQTKGNYSADAVVTTQGKDWLHKYKGLKFRTMYGVGATKDSYGHGVVNKGMTTVFVHGNFSKNEILKVIPREKIKVTGFPKYAPYYNNELVREEWLNKFELNPKLKTIVYIPTWAHNSSLDKFSEAIAQLAGDFNILFKPHHNNLHFENERLNILRNSGLFVYEGTEPNLIYYYLVADMIITDVRSGGFTESFLFDVPVIGLSQNDNPEDDELITQVIDSTALIRHPSELSRTVHNLFKDDPYKDYRNSLRNYFFEDLNGADAQIAASEMSNIISEYKQGKSTLYKFTPRAEVKNINMSPKSTVMDNDTEKPRFSVIIPTYNRPDMLLLCIEALTEQKFPASKFEVIVIDDGSTINNEEFIQNLKTPFKLIYLKQENAGPGAARNKGILAATGEYVLFINDDAVLAPNCLDVHYQAQQKVNGKKLAVLGRFDYWKEGLVKPFTFLVQNTSLVFAYNIMQHEQIYNYRFFWTCNICLPRSIIIEAGLFDENFNEPMMEDTELGYRLQKMGWQVFFTDDAKAQHLHSLDYKSYEKRQKMCGRNVVKFLTKHPELLKIEKALFGFDNFNLNTTKEIEQNLIDWKKDIELLYRFFDEVEKIRIYNPAFISVGKDKVLNREDFIKILYKKALMLHYINFYEGVLDGINNLNISSIKVEQKKEIKSITQDIQFAQPRQEPLEIEKIVKETIDLHKKTLTHKKTEQTTVPKMRILMTMFGWNESGGGTMFPKAVAKRFVSMGYDVAVFYSGMNHSIYNEPYYFEENTSFGVQLFGVFNRTKNFLMEDEPELEIKDVRIISRFIEVLDNFKPDIVHYFNFLGLSFGIADEVDKRNIPSFYSPENYHLIDPKLYMFKNNLENWFNTDIFQNSGLIKQFPEKASLYQNRIERALDLLNNKITYTLAISKRVKEILIDFGAISNKIAVVHQIPDAVENINFNELKNSNVNTPLRFAFIGTLIPHKGVHKVIAASENIIHNNFELHIFGFGNQTYINELKRLNIKSNCIWHGAYNNTQLPELLKDIDIVIIPSIWEECAGLVILEALALCKPVIISRIGGMTDFIVDGFNGYTYPFDSERNLTAIMQMLIDEPNKVLQLKQNIAINHNFSDYIEHLLKLYKDVKAGKTLSTSEMDFKVNSY